MANSALGVFVISLLTIEGIEYTNFTVLPPRSKIEALEATTWTTKKTVAELL
jgi:hypothetical protein